MGILKPLRRKVFSSLESKMSPHQEEGLEETDSILVKETVLVGTWSDAVTDDTVLCPTNHNGDSNYGVRSSVTHLLNAEIRSLSVLVTWGGGGYAPPTHMNFMLFSQPTSKIPERGPRESGVSVLNQSNSR